MNLLLTLICLLSLLHGDVSSQKSTLKDSKICGTLIEIEGSIKNIGKQNERDAIHYNHDLTLHLETSRHQELNVDDYISFLNLTSSSQLFPWILIIIDEASLSVLKDVLLKPDFFMTSSRIKDPFLLEIKKIESWFIDLDHPGDKNCERLFQMIGNTLPIAKSSSLFQHVISTTTRGERLTLVSSKDIKESIWDALYQLYMIHSESKDTRYDVQKYRLLYLNSHRIPREWMGKFATMALPTLLSWQPKMVQTQPAS
jgi:hypothetical protein